MGGLYLHIPFCKQACHYCDFHFSTSLRLKTQLVDALCKEIELQKSFISTNTLSSIYFGGGTPSILSESDLKAIFSAIHTHFHVDTNAEITLEANPDDIDAEKVDFWKKAGINRLSMGIQSFREKDLQLMNRAHTASEAFKAIEIARHSGIHDITIDLMYGLPNQSLSDWQENLNHFVALKIPHLSAYCLTVEDGTHLGRLVHTQKVQVADDELARAQFNLLLSTVKENGYEQYEISNFCLPGHEAQHNSSYWKSKPYLGIGPSAHSYNHTSRRWNVASNLKYIQAIERGEPAFEEETLSEKDKLNDYILTRLRTKWGMDSQEMKALFSANVLQQVEKALAQQLALGNVLAQGSVFVLSEKAKFIADRVSMELFVE
jgi:oxygen-independent coproporphyrinogen III oxidase